MEAEITSQAVGLSGNTDFSILTLFIRADIIVKSVIIILIVCSVYSWAVIFEKIKLFKRINFFFNEELGVFVEVQDSMMERFTACAKKHGFASKITNIGKSYIENKPKIKINAYKKIVYHLYELRKYWSSLSYNILEAIIWRIENIIMSKE